MDLLVANYGADFGALCLDGGCVCRNGHFFADAARLQSDIERSDGVNLDYDSLLQGGLETLGFDRYVVAPDGNIIYAVRAGTAGHSLVNATRIRPLDGDRRALHPRTGTVQHRAGDASTIRLCHRDACHAD